MKVTRPAPRSGARRSSGWARRVTAARAALAVFLAWPVLQFVAVYGWRHRGLNGIAGAFAVGLLGSVVDWLRMLIQQPVKTIVYVMFLGALTRLARS